MSDEDHRGSRRVAAPVEPWDRTADEAHEEGQALLDALERRARRLGRRARRQQAPPSRILKLMD